MHIRNQTTLYFIRHAQTLSNLRGIKQGNRIDEYLDTNGVIQAENVAKLVKSLDLDILYTSYLHRAEETAALINKSLPSEVRIIHDERLHERDFGSLTGKTDEELSQIIPNYKELENMQMYDYRPYGGESVDDVRQRALGCIYDIIENNDHYNIGVITHDGIIRLLLFHFPDITRIYRQDDSGHDVANADIYQWEISSGKAANIKSLLK